MSPNQAAEQAIVNTTSSMIIFFLLGALPALVVRFLLFKKPLNNGLAIAISALIWMAGIMGLVALEIEPPGTVVGMVAFGSYLVLTFHSSQSHS